MTMYGNEPRICPDDPRRELFKFFYAQQNPELFDLYKKGDAAEFLQKTLELIHFSLNPNKLKKDEDTECGIAQKNGPNVNQCLIHEKMQMNLFSTATCECNPKKPRVQNFHQNNFVHYIYAHEVIGMQSQIIANSKATKKDKLRKSELVGI